MAAPLLIFSVICVLISLKALGADGVNIKVYEHANFTGLVWTRTTSNTSIKCNNIQPDNRKTVKSIRTDTCFIVYFHPNCRSSRSEKHLPGDILLYRYQLGTEFRFTSFRLCNDKEGGSQLNLDLIWYLNYDANYSPDVLESYKNVCSCVNVPQYVQNMEKWAIDNHHNALLAYYGPNCTENKLKRRFIVAGHNLRYTHMDRYERIDARANTTYKIGSFGPAPNSTYYQISCNFSHDVTSGTSYTLASSTEGALDIDTSLINTRSQNSTESTVELRTQTKSSTEYEDVFQSERLLNAMRKLWSYSH